MPYIFLLPLFILTWHFSIYFPNTECWNVLGPIYCQKSVFQCLVIEIQILWNWSDWGISIQISYKLFFLPRTRVESHSRQSVTFKISVIRCVICMQGMVLVNIVIIMRTGNDWPLVWKGQDWRVQRSIHVEVCFTEMQFGNIFFYLECTKWVCFDSMEGAWHVLSVKVWAGGTKEWITFAMEIATE